VLLLGSGELGKEVAIELQRLGVEVIAADRYADAPAMQVAHRSHVLDMLDGGAMGAIWSRASVRTWWCRDRGDRYRDAGGAGARPMRRSHPPRSCRPRAPPAPDDGPRGHPPARCRGARVADLAVPLRGHSATSTAPAVAAIGLPCVVKPVMSSSGKGQSTGARRGGHRARLGIRAAGGRAAPGRVIVEGFVDFDYEITLLTVRHAGGTSFCAPIGHLQVDGDYRESWQPQPMSELALERARDCPPSPAARRLGHLRRGAVRARRRGAGSARFRRGRTTPGW
jgi:phosphoribosylglycinamide formyltransferase 2